MHLVPYSRIHEFLIFRKLLDEVSSEAFAVCSHLQMSSKLGYFHMMITKHYIKFRCFARYIVLYTLVRCACAVHPHLLREIMSKSPRTLEYFKKLVQIIYSYSRRASNLHTAATA